MTDWDDLRYFLAVARAGNVTGASVDLGVNHSTVSRRISAMEKRHGVRLFERLASGYLMTAAGEQIFHLAEQVEVKNQHIERLLFAQDGRLSGPLTVTMPHDLANHCVIPNLNQFTEQYPDIDLRLVVTPGLKNLQAREADLAIRLTHAPPEQLVGHKLANLRHGIYQSRTCKLNACGSPSLIVWDFDDDSPPWAKQYFPNAPIGLRVDDLASMYAAVKAGIGVARMPCYLPDRIFDADVFRLDLSLQPSTWGVWILSHQDLRSTQRVNVCKMFLKACILNQKDLFEGKQSRYLVASG